MATKPSDTQWFHQEHIHSKISPLNKGSNWVFMHILCNQNLIINFKIKFTNDLSQFMLPCQPKHHTISDFTKMVYSTKRAYSKQIISYQQYIIWIIFNIFYIIHICYTNTKNNSFKNSRLELPWQQDKCFTQWLRNTTKTEICPRRNEKLTLFRLAFVIWNLFWLHLLLALFRGPH